MGLEEYRAEFPQYKDVPDDRLADALHQQYHPEMDKTEFFNRLGYKPAVQTPAPAATQEVEEAPPGFTDPAHAPFGASPIPDVGVNPMPLPGGPSTKKESEEAYWAGQGIPSAAKVGVPPESPTGAGAEAVTWGDPVPLLAGVGGVGAAARSGAAALGSIPGIIGGEIAGSAASEFSDKLPEPLRTVAPIAAAVAGGVGTSRLMRAAQETPTVLRQTIMGGKPVPIEPDVFAGKMKQLLAAGDDYKTALLKVAEEHGQSVDQLLAVSGTPQYRAAISPSAVDDIPRPTSKKENNLDDLAAQGSTVDPRVFKPTNVEGKITPWEKARMLLIDYHGERGTEFEKNKVLMDEAARKAGLKNLSPEKFQEVLKGQVSEYQRTGKAEGPFRQFLDLYDQLRAPLDQQILSLKPDWQMREHYFRQMFKDSGAAWEAFVAKNKTSVEGAKGFLHHKKFMTWEDGLNAGLKPKYNNLADIVNADLAERRQMVSGDQFFKRLKAEGVAEFVPLGEKPPSGKSPLEDKRFQVQHYSEAEEGIVKRGNYYADKDVAYLINGQFEKGLHAKMLESGTKSMTFLSRAVDVGVKTTNVLRQIKVAGPFHFWFTDQTYRALSNEMGAVLEGSIGQAAKSTPSLVPGASLRARNIGKKLQQAFMSPGSHGPEFDEAVNNLIEGGQRFNIDRRGIVKGLFNGSDEFGNVFRDAWADTVHDLRGGHVGRVLQRGLDAVTAPIMKYHVPQVKLAAHMMLTQPELSALKVKYGVDKTGKAASKELQNLYNTEKMFTNQRASALVDNAFGQMVKENLMIKPWMKDLMSAAMQFPTWNIGSFNVLKEAAKGGLQTISFKGMDFPAKLATRLISGLLINTGIHGALLHRTMTGEWPTSFKDIYSPVVDPKTGDRLIAGTYLKTFISWAHSPLNAAAGLRNMALSGAWEVINNRDFQNTQIRDPYDPYLTQAKDVAGFMAKQSAPIMASQMERGVTPETKYAGLVGYQVPPKYATNTPFEQALHDMSKQGMIKTKRESAALDVKYQAGKLYRAGMEAESAKLLDDSVRDKKITDTQRFHIEDSFQSDPLEIGIKGLSIESAVKAWPLASDEEKKKVASEMFDKIDRAYDRDDPVVDDLDSQIKIIIEQIERLL